MSYAAPAASPPSNFPRQFLITRDSAPVNLEFRCAAMLSNGLRLEVHPGLETSVIVDASGATIGWALGALIDTERRSRVRGEVRLELSSKTHINPDYIANFIINRFGGSFIILIDVHGIRRLYLDANGTLSAVFNVAAGCAAATAGLVLSHSEYADLFDAALYAKLDILGEGWFPAGLTAHKSVSRLLVNHRLDLDTWTQTRFWPDEPIPQTEDPDKTCREIAREARSIIDACIADGSVAVALTGGNETRLLLSLLRDCTQKVDFITVSTPQTRRDVVLSRRLGSRFQLRRRELPLRAADASAQADWHARAGHCIGGTNMRSHPTIEALTDYMYFIGGLGGEVGRGFFWRSGDQPDMTVTAETIAGRFGMPADNSVLSAVRVWREAAPQMDSNTLLDLAYIELRMGCWAFAQAYCTRSALQIHPLITRSNYARMLSLPPEWRREGRFIRRIIELHWPELLEVPINSYGSWALDHGERAIRALRDPKLVLRFLRKRLAG